MRTWSSSAESLVVPTAAAATPVRTALLWSLAALGALLLGGRPAAAQSLAPQESSATCLALAGACGQQGAPSALWSNPAQLASSSSFFSLGLHLLSREQTVHRIGPIINQQPPEVRDIAGHQVIPAMAVALPLWGRLLWGAVGYHQGLLIDSVYPAQESGAILYPTQETGKDRESPGRYRGTRMELRQHVVSIGLALRFETFAAGAALELSHAALTHQQSGWAGLADDRDLLEDPHFDVVTSFSGHNALAVGGRFGARWSPLPWLSVAAFCVLPLRVELEGEVTVQAGSRAPSGTSSITATDGEAAVRLELPLRFQGGIALGPTPLRLMLEGSFTPWAGSDLLTSKTSGAALHLDGDSPLTVALSELPVALPLRDQFGLHAGVAIQPWSEVLTLRAGYSFVRGATDPDSPSSTLIDLSRHTLGLGLSVRTHGLVVGVGFNRTFEATLDAPGEQALLFNPLDSAVTTAVGEGRYSSSSIQVLMELGYGW